MKRIGVCITVGLIVAMAGCATPPQKTELQPVFFPDPPALPRIQYLTSYTGASDIEPGRSAFETFVTGEKEQQRRLDKPYGVAINNGRIYVCDTNNTVMVFDLEKKTYRPLQGAQGLGKLIQPINISIDRDGNKYVSDPVRGQVVMFDRNDFYLKSFGMAGSWKPVDAAAYGDRLYVADAQNSEIKVFSIQTTDVVLRIGSKGDDVLVMPTNISFDSEGFLYVSDAGRFQIIKYDRDGHMRETIGKLGNNPGHFARPRGIALDREKRLFVVDAAFDNIQVFNRSNMLLLAFGKAGKNPGNFFLPAKVVIDYENAGYFRKYVDPNFEVEALLLVTNQFGDRMVNVFAFGREKGKAYPTEEDLIREIEQKRKKLNQDTPDTPDETGKAKKS